MSVSVLLARRKIIALASFLCCFPAIGSAQINTEACRPDSPVSARIDLAVSVRAMERELEECASRGRCRPEQRTFQGLTRIAGLVVDRRNNDLVLVGTADAALAPLDIDDFVVAIRNVFGAYAEQNTITAPAVSIDPDPAVFDQLDKIAARLRKSLGKNFAQKWRETCSYPQDTRLLGVPPSRMGRVMLEADFAMKQITDGSMRLGIPGFESLFDSRIGGSGVNAANTNRFWFTAGPFRYALDPDGFTFEVAEVALVTEAEHLTRSGQFKSSGQTDNLAQAYACRFTKNYPKISELPGFEVYKELEDMYRWVALAQIVKGQDLFQAAGYAPLYLLNDWPIRSARLPATLPGRARVEVYQDGGLNYRLATCGGVSITFDNGLETLGEAAANAAKVVQSTIAGRPGPSALSWWLQ